VLWAVKIHLDMIIKYTITASPLVVYPEIKNIQAEVKNPIINVLISFIYSPYLIT